MVHGVVLLLDIRYILFVSPDKRKLVYHYVYKVIKYTLLTLDILYTNRRNCWPSYRQSLNWRNRRYIFSRIAQDLKCFYKL